MKKRPAAEVLGSNDKEIALGPQAVKSRIKFSPQPLKAVNRKLHRIHHARRHAG